MKYFKQVAVGWLYIYARNTFTYDVSGPFTKIRERLQKFKETLDSKTKMNQVKPVFSITWLVEIKKICFEELMVKYYLIKQLILLKLLKLLVMKEDLIQ